MQRPLKTRWSEICDEYLRVFCERHEYEYDPYMWVGSDPGTIIEVCDMFVSMENIRYDVDNNIDPELFHKWYWKSLELSQLGVEHWMNYPSYCKGAPDEWTEERMQRLREANKRVEEAKRELQDEIDSYKQKSLF